MRRSTLPLLVVVAGCDPAGGSSTPTTDLAAVPAAPGMRVAALDAAPRTIPYGGYVDFDGEPVNAGNVQFNFALFPCPTQDACAPVWVARGATASWSTSVESLPLPIFSGRFTVELGAVGQNPLPDVVFTDTHEALYLGIRIQGRTLGSLQKLTPSFRSLTTQEADRLRVRSAVELDDPAGGVARLMADDGLVIDHDGARAPSDLLLRVGADDPALSVTGERVTLGGALGVVALGAPPAGCGPATGAGLMYYDAASGLRICNGDAWVNAAIGARGLAGMPVEPTQYVEFSTVSNPTDPATWDQTKRTIPAIGTATWDATEKAYKTAGALGSYVDSRWRPGAASKTACFWKKYWDPTAMQGLDGYQETQAYFYVGTYPPTNPTWYFYSASDGGPATNQSSVAPVPNAWIFICLASTGYGGTSQIYSALPGDPQPVLRHFQASNGVDYGNVNRGPGMLYGGLSSNNEGWSKAFYGGFYHFDVSLSAAQIRRVWEATRYYYPGHGGGATR